MLSECNAIQQFARVLTEIIAWVIESIVLILFLRYFRSGMLSRLLKNSCNVFLIVNAEIKPLCGIPGLTVYHPTPAQLRVVTLVTTSPHYVVRGNGGFQIRWRSHGTGGSLRSIGYNVKINIEGEMNMLLCLYNLRSLVSVLQVQVLFMNRYALLLRRRRALYSLCLNDGGKRQRGRFKL